MNQDRINLQFKIINMNNINNVGERTRCEVWTRVMGYHRPVSYFNPGKKSEHYSRKHFEECVATNQEFRIKFKTSRA